MMLREPAGVVIERELCFQSLRTSIIFLGGGYAGEPTDRDTGGE